MRISTSTLYGLSSTAMNDIQSKNVKTLQQISSGKRILTPSDDPSAATQALTVSQAKAVNTQYSKNMDTAQNALTTSDNVLSNINDTLQDIRTTALTASSFTDDQRQSAIVALQSQLTTLTNLANSKDADGNYLYSGTLGSTQPFTTDSNGVVQYNGNDDPRNMQIGENQTATVNDSGNSIFMNINGSGQSMFDTINNLITVLQTPGSNISAGAQTAVSGLNDAIANISSMRASVGARMNSLTSQQDASSNMDTQYQGRLSQLQDLDYNTAATTLAQQQTQLQAAQKAFSYISGMSLFSYL